MKFIKKNQWLLHQYKVDWIEPEKLSISVTKFQYPLTGEYVDDSKNILQELVIEEDNDDDDDTEFQMETVDNEDIQML